MSAEVVQTKLIMLVNEMIKHSEPFTYEELNVKIKAKDYAKFVEFEKINQEVGITQDGWSTLSLIATITDVLCGKRLAFIIDDNGYVIGVRWWEPTQER